MLTDKKSKCHGTGIERPFYRIPGLEMSPISWIPFGIADRLATGSEGKTLFSGERMQLPEIRGSSEASAKPL
jgi:hypothetical protein